MHAALAGLIWAIAFVLLESIQFVWFGGLFQRVNSFVFGFSVLGVVVALFVGRAALIVPEELTRALRQPGLLFKINAAAALGWVAFLGSVQLIEPAVAYTIGSGVMPLTALALYYLGWGEGEALRNRAETLGTLVVALAVLALGVITLAGLSGFVRGGGAAAALGIALAVSDGVWFTLMLAWCQRLGRQGVGPGAIFGLRFPLYVLLAGTLGLVTAEKADVPQGRDMVWMIALGLALIVPPLYALQRAVALVSTMTLGTMTAAGPFVIFLLQIFEGRVDQSGLTLAGLGLYFAGAVLAAAGAVRATVAR